MAKHLKIVIAQLNFFVGDIQGNLDKSINAAKLARDELKADCIVFPELNLTGYPPEDLLLRKSFIDASNEALYEFKDKVHDIYAVISHPHANSQGLFNSSSIIYNGNILGRYSKQHLPNYGVFDEDRYFIPGNTPCVIDIAGIPVGLIVCEDIWNTTPIQQAANLGARIILVPNASPFETDKHEQRHAMLAKRSKQERVPIVYVNCVGQQDEITFDGGSFVVDQEGKICQFAGFFNEVLLPVDFEITATETKIVTNNFPLPLTEQRIYDCLVLAVKDYLQKNNVSGALVGLSGGIDSALTLAIAVDALGKDNVKAVMMPSYYTAEMSLEDSKQLTETLGVDYEVISINDMFELFLNALQIDKETGGLTAENIQARCRGLILMAISNKTGKIVLNTSNRSELAVGYGTLYGDMIGGFAVLKDIPKTMVYQLAEYRNKIKHVIPDRIIERAPSAELAKDQKDEDSLPPYSILDKILDLFLNQELSIEDIILQGFERVTVEKVANLIKKSEYKRRQAPPGARINHKAFGRDRRYPISSGFKG